MISTLIRAFTILAIGGMPSAAPANAATSAAPLDTAYFAGGCFWGVQAVFQHVTGVVTATSGYSDHAESVRVVFDPARVSYETLVDVFFTVVHDPTQLDRQGPDVGPQYRSAAFYTSPAQHQAVARWIVQARKSRRFAQPIVTQVTPFKTFETAAAYHQDYATRHPTDRYIAYNDLPKIAALRQRYASLWSERIAGH